jgi:hypothetical protein
MCHTHWPNSKADPLKSGLKHCCRYLYRIGIESRQKYILISNVPLLIIIVGMLFFTIILGSKNPSKWPITCFDRIQKITSQIITISCKLVFLCTIATPCLKFFFMFIYSPVTQREELLRERYVRRCKYREGGVLTFFFYFVTRGC